MTLTNTVAVDNYGEEENGVWETYQSKKRRSRNKENKKLPIIGTKTLTSERKSKVRAVEKRNLIFVSRLACDVTKEDIEEYMKEGSVEAECSTLKPKYETYRSFKVSVKPEDTGKVLNCDFWPVGTLVREFLLKNSQYVRSQTFLGRPNATRRTQKF